MLCPFLIYVNLIYKTSTSDIENYRRNCPYKRVKKKNNFLSWKLYAALYGYPFGNRQAIFTISITGLTRLKIITIFEISYTILPHFFFKILNLYFKKYGSICLFAFYVFLNMYTPISLTQSNWSWGICIPIFSMSIGLYVFKKSRCHCF